MPWRALPRSAVNWSELGLFVLGALLLVFLGVLLGTAWTTQAVQPQLDHQAEERRRLNEEWVAVRAAHQQLVECPRCGYPLTAQDSYFAFNWIEDSQDDD
jgi:cell division protein FtsL